MLSQPGKQTISLYLKIQTWETNILPYISRSKDNHTVKFSQLIEHYMRKIFPEQSYPKCGGETSPKLFPKKSKIEHISGSIV